MTVAELMRLLQEEANKFATYSIPLTVDGKPVEFDIETVKIGEMWSINLISKPLYEGK